MRGVPGVVRLGGYREGGITGYPAMARLRLIYDILRLIGSYGRLTGESGILLRSEILGSRSRHPGPDPGPDPGFRSSLRTSLRTPRLVLRPASKNPISNIYRFKGSFTGID